MDDDRYYRPALARIHHEGFGFHADTCAPGILALLDGVRRREVRPLLEAEDLRVEIGHRFGEETNMEGLRVVIAHRPEA